MEEFIIKNRHTIKRYLYIMLAVVCVYIFFKYIFFLIAPFIVAFILSLALEPIIRFMTDKLRINRGLASLIAVVFILSLLGLLIMFIFSQINAQAQKFISDLPLYMIEIQTLFDRFRNAMAEKLNMMPEEIKNFLFFSNFKFTESFTTSISRMFQKQGILVVSSIPGIFMFVFVTLLATFFMCKDKDMLAATIKRNSKRELIRKYYVIKNTLFSAVGGYFKAQLILMSIISLICMTALQLLASDYALFLGLVIAFVDALPIFGSGFILWPWALVCLLEQNYSMAIGLIICYLIVVLTRQILEPRILGKQIGIHPLFTLLAVYVGLKLFGPFGLILGPLSAVLVKALMESFAN